MERGVSDNQFLDLILHAADLGVWDWDLLTDRMTYSARAREICGFPAEGEIMLDQVIAATHPDDLTWTRPMARRACDPGLRERQPYRYRIVRPGGEIRWVVANGEAVFVDTPDGARAVRYIGTLQDVTEQHVLAEAERASRSLLSIAMSAARMAMWEAKIADARVTMTPELARLIGFGEPMPTLEEMRARYPAGALETFQARLAEALARGDRSIEFESPYLDAEGATRWFALRAEPRGPLGEAPTHLVGVLFDISERKDAEARLTESEQRLRLVVESMSDAFYALDDDFRFTVFNAAAEHYFGTSRDKVLGRSLWALFPQGRGTAFETLCLRAMNEGAASITELPSAMVTGRIVELRIAPMPHGITVTVADVTESRAAAAALRESETRFREITNAMPQLVWIAGADGAAEYHNDRRELYAGFCEVGPAAVWGPRVHPDDMERTAELWSRALCTGDNYACEHRLQMIDGDWRWHISRAVRSPSGDDRPYRWFGTATDIHTLKQAEADLAAINESLEARVAERTADLLEAQEALQQSRKLEAMGQLTGGVAHDFNNLLTPIIGGLDLLQRQGLGNARQQRAIDGALQAAERARTLVGRLLAFARRQPLQTGPVDLAGLIRGMEELIVSTCGTRINVMVDLPTDAPSVIADRQQLEMALLNLCVNARDAMPEGGTLTISIAHPPGTARPGTLVPGDYVRIAIRDTGHGMDAEIRARAIEPFYTTKGPGRGTGLGLSMAHGLASQLGGALTITSAPGEGTEIALWLPTCPPLAAGAPPADVQADPPGSRGRILVVDDEDLVRATTADLLADMGFVILEASSAEQAMAILDGGEHLDMVVTDQMMPGKLGTDLVDYVRRRRPTVPVLLVSGYAGLDSLPPDLPRLAKPFREAELAAAIAGLDRGLAACSA